MDEDNFDDEPMCLDDDPLDEDIASEFDDVESTDDEEADGEDNAADNEDQVVDDLDATNTVGKDKEISEPDENNPEVGYCHICEARVLLDELPDSISRDAFEQFGLCLNCQWGSFIENGGHF